MLKLRPHHLLCIEFFEGKGYDLKHIENMYRVIDTLNEEDIFLLTDKPDDICSCCPNSQEDKCKTQSKVLRYDSAVKDMLNLKYGREYSYRELKSIVEKEIAYLLKNTCRDCEWASICHNKNGKN